MEAVRCSNEECQVCQLNKRLIRDGAESISWSDLCEQHCHLHVYPSNDHRCLHGLRLDVEDADYRRVSKREITRMCDFSVLAVLDRTAQLIVVELKSGIAYAKDIDQLSEGLRVLYERFRENSLIARPEAYFVVGRDIDKLAYSLRDKLTSLRFGTAPVQLNIVECGTELHL